jgi:hypothetical protein
MQYKNMVKYMDKNKAFVNRICVQWLREPLIIINLSLQRRRESSDLKSFWIPAFAGMTFLEVALSLTDRRRNGLFAGQSSAIGQWFFLWIALHFGLFRQLKTPITLPPRVGLPKWLKSPRTRLLEVRSHWSGGVLEKDLEEVSEGKKREK